MNSELQKHVIEIYADYQPLKNVHRTLINQNPEKGFKKLVDDKINHLTSCEQKRVQDELFGWGPLQELIDREDIFDIIVQGPENIYFDSFRGIERHDDQFYSPRSFQNFIERISHQAGLLINHKDPFANGKVGPFRLHLAVPPIASTPTLTLRRHGSKKLTLKDYENSGFLTKEQSRWLTEMLSDKKNFLVVGPTGSGKTTFLNTLIATLPKPQRLVVIEDTDEIQVEDPLACKLLSREICPETLSVIKIEDLVKQALRMRPDRLVVGEVRGPEAKDLLQALATGHSGSMGTMHAQSGQQALLRLEMLIQMGAPQWSLNSIRQLIMMSIDYIIVLKEDRQNKGLQSVHRVASVESFGVLLEDLKWPIPER